MPRSALRKSLDGLDQVVVVLPFVEVVGDHIDSHPILRRLVSCVGTACDSPFPTIDYQRLPQRLPHPPPQLLPHPPPPRTSLMIKRSNTAPIVALMIAAIMPTP